MLLSCPRARFEAARAYRDLTLSESRSVAIGTCRAKEDVSFEYFLCLDAYSSHMQSAQDLIRSLLPDPNLAARVIEELRIKMASPYLTPSSAAVLDQCRLLQKELGSLERSEKKLQLQLAMTTLDPLTPEKWFQLGKSYEMCSATVSALLSFAMAAYLTNGDLQLAAETTNLFLDWQEKDAARALTSEISRDLINDPRYRKQGFELRELARSMR